jgi:hypothetical protein
MTIHARAARPPDWPKDRLRRISSVAARSGEGLLSDHIAGVRPVQRERVFVRGVPLAEAVKSQILVMFLQKNATPQALSA